MSLIEEALRRDKDPLVSQPQAVSPTPQTQPQTTAPTQTTQDPLPLVHSWSPVPTSPNPHQRTSLHTTPLLIGIALAMLGLTAAFLIGGAFWLGRTLGWGALAVRVAPPTLIPGQTSESRVSLEAKHIAQSSSNELVLTGVVEGVGEPYAMINGTIVGLGEQIGGSTLVAITHGVAKLHRPDGTELELRVPR